MTSLPPQDIALIEKIKRAKVLQDTYLPRRLTDEEFVELRKLEQELDPIDTKQFLLDIIERQQKVLDFIMQQEPALSDYGKEKVTAILNGDVK